MRSLLIAASALTLLAVTSAAEAQDIDSRLTDLERKLDELERRYDRDLPILAQGVLDNRGRIDTHDSAISGLRSAIDDNTTKLRDLATQDPSGRYVPNILGNMQSSSEFRRDFQRAVWGSAPIIITYPGSDAFDSSDSQLDADLRRIRDGL